MVDTTSKDSVSPAEYWALAWQLWSSTTHDFENDCICEDAPLRLDLRECPVTGHAADVRSVAFSPDGKSVVSGSGDTLVKIWNAATGAEVTSSVGVR